MLCRFINEIRLLACDPGVRLHLGKVNATPAQRGNEVAGVKVLEPLGTAQNGLAESHGDIRLSKQDLPSDKYWSCIQ